MKSFFMASVAALAATAIAQSANPGDLPTCAKGCLDLDNLPKETGCGQFDYHCICSSKTFIADISCCVSKACSKADQASVLSFANGICKVVGVTLPTAAACSAGAAATGSSASGASSAAASTGSSSASSVPSSSSITSGSSSALATGSSGSISTTAAPTTGSSASAASASTPTSTASSAGAAHLLVQGAGAAGGFAAALVAFL